MTAIRSELVAVLTAVQGDTPMVLTLDEGASFPAGPLETSHRSLQRGLRLWVERQTGYRLGHVEQLYTFAETSETDEPRIVRVSYMALTRAEPGQDGWRGWYDYFPWENRSATEGSALLADIENRLTAWASGDEARLWRCALNFGFAGQPWDDELVLQRYELLWEAGLVAEAPHRASRVMPGHSMARDHRRILATAMARLRAKIRYRPVVFELMPETFTLWQLQRTVEAIAGRPLHKQNFRRLILQQELVEETGDVETSGQGRPARLYRFRGAVIGLRQAVGSKLPIARSV